jgi:hypothetical protein
MTDRSSIDRSSIDRSSDRSSVDVRDRNCVLLLGTVRSEPAWYDRDQGRACCFELEIAGGPEVVGARVPVAWIDPPRKGSIVRIGAPLAVAGQIHQRFFRAEGRTLARIEVITTQVTSARSRARAVAMLDGAVG